jgi:16S rRNA (adenine1518-N6/adenine1519-N6)-dimethyltransferase
MEYRLKKSLGQHFLTDESVCKQIVDAVVKENPTHLVEVGPGAGAITKYFLKLKDIEFKAVELDTEKVGYLLKNFPKIEGKLINESILNTEMPFTEKFDVVGNFPYNISTEILFKMLDWKENINSITGMFQKEVAQRIAAKHGNKVYGVISVLLQAFFKVEYLFDVPPTAFKPPPKVNSGVIQLKPLQNILPMQSDKKFKQLVKAAFNQRRKTMRNACKSLFLPEQLLDPIFEKRAEQLSVEDFAALSFKMQ